MQTLTNKLNLIKALLSFQKEVPIIFKGTKGYNYTYSDLAEIMKAIQTHLTKNDLGITQNVSIDGSIVSLTTIVFHSSGEFIESTLTGDVQLNGGKMNNIQVVGSLTTYLRRYAISSMLNLVTDKDIDGANGNGEGDKNKNKDNGNNNNPPPPKQPDNNTQTSTKQPVDDWTMIDAIPRWNKTKKCLNEAYQKKHNLINSLEWKKIQELVNKKLNSDMAVFTKWLDINYKVIPFDITDKMLPGIITAIDCNPNEIIDSVADKK